jgi:polar amino acid transport system substrate-binding protein
MRTRFLPLLPHRRNPNGKTQGITNSKFNLSGKMNKFTKRLTSMLLAQLLVATISVNSQTIKLVTVEWPPYVIQNVNHRGFVTDIVVKSFANSGYVAEVDYMPWKRGLKAVEAGKYDAIYPMYHTEVRDKTYALSQSIGKSIVGFVRRMDFPFRFNNLPDLVPYKIGVVRGYANRPDFDAADYLKKLTFDNDRKCLSMLLNKRVDLIVIDKYTYLEKHFKIQ